MEYLIVYLIFTIATALSATYEVFIPVIKDLGSKLEYPNLTLVVMFVMSMVLAPFILLSIVFRTEQFKKNLYEALKI